MADKKLIKSVSSYTDSKGEKRNTWRTIGELFESNGKTYLKLYINPDTLYHVFEPREDDQDAEPGQTPF